MQRGIISQICISFSQHSDFANNSIDHSHSLASPNSYLISLWVRNRIHICFASLQWIKRCSAHSWEFHRRTTQRNTPSCYDALKFLTPNPPPLLSFFHAIWSNQNFPVSISFPKELASNGIELLFNTPWNGKRWHQISCRNSVQHTNN